MELQQSPECRKRGGAASTKETTFQPDGTTISKEEVTSWHEGTLEAMSQILGTGGMIAIIVIGTACSISLIQIYRGQSPELPKYLYEFSLLVLGYYFGQKSKTERSKKNNHAVENQVGFHP